MTSYVNEINSDGRSNEYYNNGGHGASPICATFGYVLCMDCVCVCGCVRLLFFPKSPNFFECVV